MRKQIIALFIFLLLIPVFGTSQNHKPIFPFNIGIWGTYSGTFTSVDLKWYTPTEGLVGSAGDNFFSSGIGFGGILNYPITENLFITGRIGFNHYSTDLNFFFFNYSTGTVTVYENVSNLSLSYLEITPGIVFYPKFPNLNNLYFLGGLEIGSYINKEFQNTLTNTTSDLPDAKTRFALALGAGYTFQIADNIYLSPEVSFRLPLTKFYDQDYISTDIQGNQIGTQNEQMSFSQLRIGLNLTFSLSPKKETPVVPVGPSGNVGFKQVLALDNSGNFVPATSIKVQDTRYQEYFPLVPYIFFEQNSSKPAENTQIIGSKAEAGAFEPQNLPLDALEINKRTLDIVGWRLKNIPNADLTVIGTTDGTNIEKNNKQLPAERANFVKKYLVENWGINEQRINTRTVQFPSKPSTSNVPEGVAENRRAELSSSNPEILAPILIESENQRIAEPGLIQFIPYADVQDSISFWEIDIYQGGNLLKRQNGSGQPQTLHWTIKPNELAANNIPVDYTLIVETINGKKYSAKGSIPTEYISQVKKRTEEQPDLSITKFSLVLFDFDKADVSSADREVINRLVIPNIKFNSTVKIYGYTDKIGDDEYNLKLATRRAEAVKNIIQQKRKDVKIETYGVGERALLFDNDLPTGRHLSRTVQILIVTPK
ncbi:MAG: hypothetical protein CH6_0999 [Candidatus Kapaibacterium sp.]|nr:MAG: hypothetical protein CH6_0999 [Candidatus Kapabacteria bacterium]